MSEKSETGSSGLKGREAQAALVSLSTLSVVKSVLTHGDPMNGGPPKGPIVSSFTQALQTEGFLDGAGPSHIWWFPFSATFNFS